MANPLDPYACGPQCCEPEKCDKDPLEILITNGMPQGKPDPCDHLPIAYDAATGCFYMWHENSGWFEASGVRIQHNNTDTAGEGDSWDIEVCTNAIRVYNSRNVALDLIRDDNDVAGFPQHLRLTQTYGPTLTVDLSSLDSYVSGLTIEQTGNIYELVLTQTEGRPTRRVTLPPYLLSVATDDSIDGNGTVADPLSVNWDNLCPNAESITDPDGYQVVVCGPNGVKKIEPDDLLNNACFDIPDLGSTCGLVKSVVVVETAPGCQQLATVTQASLAVASGGYHAVRGSKPINTSGFVLPDEFPTPNLYYTLSDLQTDGGTDPNSRPGVDETKVSNARIAAAEFDNPCQQVFDLRIRAQFMPEASAETAYSKSANVTLRYRVDGGDWRYAYTPGTGLIAAFGAQRAIEGAYEVDTLIFLPSGHIEVELFYLAATYNAGSPTHARFQANTNVPGYAVPSPQFVLTRRSQ